jgi:hypothetical protein
MRPTATILKASHFNLFYLDYMQSGQQVAVRQSEVISINELPLGNDDILSGVVVDLLRKRGYQVVIQTLELP